MSFLTRFGSRPWRAALYILGCFLSVVGARWLAITKYGSDVPIWDQWGAEGENMMVPWLLKHEIWRPLFISHSEHRIAPTKALNLALAVLSGQWDGRVECVVNVILLGSILGVFLLWVFRHFDTRWSIGAGLIATLLLSFPIAVENILSGFQSVFFFFIGFSLLALYGLLNAKPFSVPWFLAVVAGLLAVVSLGSGFVFALPLGFTAFLRLFRQREKKSSWIALGVATAFIILGWLTRPHAPWQDGLHARSVGEFVSVFFHYLAWPLSQHGVFALLFWLPNAVLAIRWLRAKPELSSAGSEFILTMSLWTVLQIGAVSYARGALGGMPPTRYFELLSFGLTFSFLSLSIVAKTLSPRFCFVYGVVWAAAVVVGGGVLFQEVTVGFLPDRKERNVNYERNLQAYAVTRDENYINKAPYDEIPFLTGELIAGILKSPEMKNALPASIRRPIEVAEDDSTSPIYRYAIDPAVNSFDPRRFWGTYLGKMEKGRIEWRSAAILPSGFWYWRFEVAGNLGRPNTSLRLISAATGALLAEIKPYDNKDDRWRPVYIKAPSEPAILVAQDSNPAGWFAFSEPVEVGFLPYWARKFAKYGLAPAFRWFGGHLRFAFLVTPKPALFFVSRKRKLIPLVQPRSFSYHDVVRVPPLNVSALSTASV